MENLTIGGAFHTGVEAGVFVFTLSLGVAFDGVLGAFGELGEGGAFREVFGGEWSYGTLGVRCEAPRTAAGHTYRCSIPLGPTGLSPLEARAARLLCQLVLCANLFCVPAGALCQLVLWQQCGGTLSACLTPAAKWTQ